MNRQMTPITTGVAIIGTMSSDRASLRPRAGRENSSASKRPITTCRLTVPNTWITVLRMMIQKFRSSVSILT